jgi:D-sedoheptulose 7-phosphate isomerase
MTQVIAEKLEEAIGVLQQVRNDEHLLDALAAAAEKTAAALQAGGKLLIAGNGGSAADAQHLAAEFVCRLTVDRPALRAIALTTDSSSLTAIGNDYGYEDVFARQVEALGQRGDFFLGISTSGNSKNILKALALSRKLGLTTIGFSGRDGGQMPPLCDYSIVIPSAITAHIQEAHLTLEHIFCHLVERACCDAEFFANHS